MDRPIKLAANLCFETSCWEESFGVWESLVESGESLIVSGGSQMASIVVYHIFKVLFCGQIIMQIENYTYKAITTSILLLIICI